MTSTTFQHTDSTGNTIRISPVKLEQGITLVTTMTGTPATETGGMVTVITVKQAADLYAMLKSVFEGAG